MKTTPQGLGPLYQRGKYQKIYQNLLSLVPLTGWFNNLACELPKRSEFRKRNALRMLPNVPFAMEILAQNHRKHPNTLVHMFTAMHIYFNFEVMTSRTACSRFQSNDDEKYRFFHEKKKSLFFMHVYQKNDKFKLICVIMAWKMWDLRLGTMKRFRKKKTEKLYSKTSSLYMPFAIATCSHNWAEMFSSAKSMKLFFFWRSSIFHCPRYAGFLLAKSGIFSSIYAKLRLSRWMREKFPATTTFFFASFFISSKITLKRVVNASKSFQSSWWLCKVEVLIWWRFAYFCEFDRKIDITKFAKKFRNN